VQFGLPIPESIFPGCVQEIPLPSREQHYYQQARP